MEQSSEKESDIYKRMQEARNLFQNKPHAIDNIMDEIKNIVGK